MDPNPNIWTKQGFISRVGEFLLRTPVIPAKAGHAVKLSRYPESDLLNILDPCLRRDDGKNTPMAHLFTVWNPSLEESRG